MQFFWLFFSNVQMNKHVQRYVFLLIYIDLKQIIALLSG